MIVLGIDPGLSGGLAVVDAKSRLITQGGLMPTIENPKTGKRTVDARTIYDWALSIRMDPGSVVVIENVHSMPAQGVASSFTFGKAMGAVQAVAQIISTSVHLVTPQQWKTHHGLGSDKQASIHLAMSLFGKTYPGTLKKHEAIAEAALIALWWLDTVYVAA